MPELRMPTLGADMTSGKLLAWHVAPGDHVRRGDIVATVDTDKAEIDIETFEEGVVDTVLVEPGTKVPVGAVLATLRADGAAAAAPPPAAPPAPVAPAPAPVAPAPAPAAPPPAAPPPVAPPPVAAAPPAPAAPPPAPPAPVPAPVPAGRRLRVSPLARRVAADLGIDLATVTGTGPNGAITRADVERAAPAPAEHAPPPAAPPTAPAAPAAEHRPAEERMESLRAAVGRLMARSKREIPHYVVQQTIDLSVPLAWLEAYNSARPPAQRLLPAALLLRAVALAAHDVPEINGTYEDGAFHPAPEVKLGVAVSLRAGGIIAPAIERADHLELPELMQALRELTSRARRGVLRGTDLAGATLTVTSLGDQGADLVAGVIFPPQVALVGFGRIAERPVAREGLVGARPTVVATLAGDHRVSDGHRGSIFLASVDHHLQEPDQL